MASKKVVKFENCFGIKKVFVLVVEDSDYDLLIRWDSSWRSRIMRDQITQTGGRLDEGMGRMQIILNLVSSC